MSETVPAWTAWMLSKLGVSENPPQSNDQPFGAFVGENGVAWCAIFQACAHLMNNGPVPYWSAGCREWALEAEQRGEWKASTQLAVTGLIVIRSWQGLSLHDPNLDPAEMHAQGILSVSGSALNLIGGNQNSPTGGIVSRDTVTIGDASICGVIDTRNWFAASGPAKVIPVAKPTKSPSHPNPMPMLYEGQPDTPQSRHFTGEAQASLNMLGPDHDGIFGDKTKARVLNFQAQHNLTQDGVVGPITYKALKIAA